MKLFTKSAFTLKFFSHVWARVSKTVFCSFFILCPVFFPNLNFLYKNSRTGKIGSKKNNLRTTSKSCE